MAAFVLFAVVACCFHPRGAAPWQAARLLQVLSDVAIEQLTLMAASSRPEALLLPVANTYAFLVMALPTTILACSSHSLGAASWQAARLLEALAGLAWEGLPSTAGLLAVPSEL